MDFPAFYNELGDFAQALVILVLALAAHGVVMAVRAVTGRLMAARHNRKIPKARTIVSLVSSVLIFVIYFSAVGGALTELGVPVGAYIASASIIGLAIAFGSQGVVQDVVSGVTIIFTDLFDVGDMVEIGGQVGTVDRLGMRFTVLRNAFGAEVFVPNRTITNVINYPRGYLRCLADVTLSADAETAKQMETVVRQIATATYEQFPGILVTPPDDEGLIVTSSGRTFLRLKFRIWPGRGSPIETNFKQEALQALKALDPAYADWMIAVNYEIEEKRPRSE
jgi:small conductance mechanosensitive channel